MAWFPFPKRRDPPQADATPAEQVQRARTRARQRLIGAVVLLGVGIVGFPLLFETQPRPIPVDVAIEIPRKDAVPPLAAPAAAGSAPQAPARTRASGQVSAPASAPEAVAASAPATPQTPPPVAPQPTPVAQPPEPAPAANDDGERARALLEARPTAMAAAPVASERSDATGARFVVQVGAFADRGAAQKTRERVERLGLKTYTQVVETRDGPRTRVRVGPFASRDEADKAVARLKTAGLAAAVLTL
ncbi:MAG: SPOR domain-containing protein [Gammaproteobacteria bacterium]